MTRRTIVVVLAVVALVGGLVAWGAAWQERSTDAARNGAVVDVTDSGTVQREVSSAIARVLAYDASSPDETQAAAEELLVGKAREEHATLFASLVERAKDQQLVMDVEVQAAAVQQLHGDEATLLVFLDQTSRRATDQESSVAAAQLVVDARRVDGTWKVSSLRVL
ncbi:hypothetical protein [Aeromicrobium sp. IC_218]|uniref:hypothetical protein n=1 Tax=Aeromicrobium sp. IC_218 TaxID=2545468 RepID=UPI00103C541A|nr:hypothetical protein [Aeromicrobium sp. IC_218]TCI97564.1 hypothetical protein E0W78_12290 [Aeromicrobium sp. IC_218]